ncbi:hypothetical protein Rt10032_c29g6862 [Rhodotorula toruloides]|uniref:Uncharacterized protein n=1 Tax=Rhodotorula toruloides TaxID=5286 RepID=A0A511KSC6_RHOTO|nr:hypothetical protein Rt10032_c29g6862 [Rhodotorula toruloides]
MGSTVAPTLPSAARLSEFTAFFDALSYISSEDTEPEAATSSRFSPPPQTPLSPDSPMFKSEPSSHALDATPFTKARHEPRAQCDRHIESAFDAPPVPAWLAAGDPANDLAFNDEIIKAVNPRTLRPKLAIKISSPNLRGNVRGFGRDDESSFLSPISGVTGKSGAGLLRHFEQPDALSRADSSFSMATMSSARTITPSPVAPVPTVAGGSMAEDNSEEGFGRTATHPLAWRLAVEQQEGDCDRRARPCSSDIPAAPTARICTIPSYADFDGASCDPAASWIALPGAILVQLTAPARENMRNARGSKSSISSFEDLWGTAFPSTFRQTPSGRVECVRTDEFGRLSMAQEAVRRRRAYADKLVRTGFDCPTTDVPTRPADLDDLDLERRIGSLGRLVAFDVE